MTTPGAPDASTPFTPQARHLAVVSGGSGDPSQTRMLAERMAMVTPEENTGSRNSAALPSSAMPGPCRLLTLAA